MTLTLCCPKCERPNTWDAAEFDLPARDPEALIFCQHCKRPSVLGRWKGFRDAKSSQSVKSVDSPKPPNLSKSARRRARANASV